MKKVFLFLMACFLSLTMSAKVAYLVPTATSTGNDTDVAFENVTIGGTTTEVSPEQNAWQWFKTEYVDKGTGVFIGLQDLANLSSDITTIWVNVDRKMTKTDLDNIFNATYNSKSYKDYLSDYVKSGHNLYLTTFASRLAWSMGRMSQEPGFSENNEFGTSGDSWWMAAKFFDKDNQDNHSHKALAELTGWDTYHFPMQGDKVIRSDRNCVWQGFRDDANASNNRFNNFQGDYNCKILGSWGHNKDLECAGLVEFYPNETFRGTIIANGLAACSFAKTNGYVAHVKELAKGVLAYLEGSAYWNDGKDPKDGVVGSADTESNRYGSAFSGYSVTAVSSNPAVVDIEGCASCDQKGTIWYNGVGQTTITATYVGDGFNSCKTPIEITKTINVTAGDANAKYLYLLHTTLNNVVEDDADKSEKPEVNAANWFSTEYVKNNTGRFVAFSEIPTTVETAKGKVLWVNVDRKMTSSALDALFSSANITAISNFVKAGGNLYLTGYAAHLANKIGRAPVLKDGWWNLAFGTYGDANDNWLVNANITGMTDMHSHAIYAKMAEGSYKDSYRYEMQHSDAKKRSDRNALWEIATAEDMKTWQTNNNCQILGEWGHEQKPNCAGIVEFFPNGDYTGTVITNGLAACSFATDNNHVNHVKNLTKGTLEYLGKTNPFDFTWLTEPVDAAITSTQVVKVEHKSDSEVFFQVLEPNADKASFGEITKTNEGDYATLTCGSNEATNVKIKVLRKGDGKSVPKNVEFSVEKDINIVTPSVVWETAPEATGRKDAEVAISANLNTGGFIEMHYDCNNCSYSAETGKITLTTYGDETVQPYIMIGENRINGEKKTIRVSPAISWSTAPESGCVGETGKKAIATCADNDVTIKYTSSHPTAVAVDAEGNLTFKAHVDGKVTITATPYVGESAYEPITGELDANKPNVRWGEGQVKTAWVGETIDLTGNVQYGSAVVLYEITSGDATVSADGKKLKINGTSDVTIKPYVKPYETRYPLAEDDQLEITITVNTPALSWTHKPDNAIIGESKEPAKATCTPASTVKYKSSNAEVASIDENSGQITYKAVGNCTITAYTTVYDLPYEITFDITVGTNITTYERTVSPNKYGTICLERTSTALEGATFYWPAYKDKAAGAVDYIVLEEVHTLTAGQGYFFYATSSEVKVTMSLAEEPRATPIDKGLATHGMHGNFTGTKNVPDYNPEVGPNEYVLNSNSELVYGVGNWIGEHRAYLKMSEVPNPTAQVPGRRYVTMVVNNPNTTTGLENATLLNGETTKFVQNGKIYIMRSGRLYTTDGRLVK